MSVLAATVAPAERAISVPAETRALDAYAWSMLGTHACVWLYFVDSGLLQALVSGVEPLCWPFFEDCWQWRLPSAASADLLMRAYMVAIVCAGIALAHGRAGTFRGLLAVLNVSLIAIISLDYRLRANQFYMLLWLNAVFLLWPRRIEPLAVLIVAFYFWAGLLKVNVEWLSGAVLYHDLWLIPPRYYWAACTYVVALEVVGIWGLLSRRRGVAALTGTQLALFHLQSLSQIHWFYPLLMAAILSLFAIVWRTHALAALPRVSDIVRGRLHRSTYALLALFAACQLAPAMYPGDSALTGQGRIFALHMFEARQVCEVQAVIGGTRPQVIDLKLHNFPPRMICDPIVYYSRIKNLCRRLESARAADLRFVLRARRTTEAALRTIVDEPGFCRASLSYAVLAGNDWMH